MILRRTAEAFRSQDWVTVTVETLMVVLGVFLGLQVNNWNEARAERERSREYLSRIRAELVADMTELERHRGLWQQVANEGYAAVSYAETGARGGATDWEVLGPVRIFVCEAYHDDQQESVCQASASSPSGRSLSLS